MLALSKWRACVRRPCVALYAVPNALRSGAIKHFIPLHDKRECAVLERSWVKALWKPQPFDAIRRYFGEVRRCVCVGM